MIGESLLGGDVRLRNEARGFALFLHECVGEQATLDWLLSAQHEVGGEAVMAPLGLSAAALNDAWKLHQAGERCPAGLAPQSVVAD